MKYLGIDYGTTKVGIAVSDETGTIATPVAIISNTDQLVGEVCRLYNQYECEAVVIGESCDHAGNENPVMKRIKPFAKALEYTCKTTVYFESEFLTTVQAGQYAENQKYIDASAAALILQSYLDRNKKI